MTKLVILVEELSMKELLIQILPKLLPAGFDLKVIPHQGKSDLEQSITRKLKAWRDPTARFIILRDNDRGDCMKRKLELTERVRGTGRERQTKIRIVCQELEAWVIGDLKALETSKGPASRELRKMASFPDEIEYPVRVLEKSYGYYAKTASASEVARHMDPSQNVSPSFQAFVAAIKELVET